MTKKFLVLTIFLIMIIFIILWADKGVFSQSQMKAKGWLSYNSEEGTGYSPGDISPDAQYYLLGFKDKYFLPDDWYFAYNEFNPEGLPLDIGLVKMSTKEYIELWAAVPLFCTQDACRYIELDMGYRSGGAFNWYIKNMKLKEVSLKTKKIKLIKNNYGRYFVIGDVLPENEKNLKKLLNKIKKLRSKNINCYLCITRDFKNLKPDLLAIVYGIYSDKPSAVERGKWLTKRGISNYVKMAY